MSSEVKLTTSWGAPIDDNQNSLTVGPFGPILLQDTTYVDKIAHFDRERIPERVVHAKGAGAHGYFEVTADVTKWTKAKFLNKVGKRTPVFARFSTVAGEKGSGDQKRDPRGFAIKHYTEEGIYDMVGNNTPIFFIRDPMKFPDFIHTQKRNPQTNVPDPNAFWDFATLVPECVHQFTFVFTDRGTPYSYRHMNGYSSHTFKWVNEKDEAFWIKLHYKTAEGIRNMTRQEADLADGDHSTKDLFNHIQSGKQAVWKAFVQIMPVQEAVKYKWNVFDITKVWPHKDYPLYEYGRLVLNRNPMNYFAEVEQAAFSPGHLVPGVEASPDRMLQGRLFSYPDTHRHRLGANYNKLPINCPYACKVANYQRDAPHAGDGNSGNEPNFEPNSISTAPKQQAKAAIKKFYVEDWAARYPQVHPNSDFEQTGNLWRNVLSETDREHLIDNMSGHVVTARKDLQQRWFAIIRKCDVNYATRLEAAVAAKSKSAL